MEYKISPKIMEQKIYALTKEHEAPVLRPLETEVEGDWLVVRATEDRNVRHWSTSFTVLLPNGFENTREFPGRGAEAISQFLTWVECAMIHPPSFAYPC